MSLANTTPHGYHPTSHPDPASSILRINKRITAKPIPFTPTPAPPRHEPSLAGRGEPFIVRLALKTTYSVTVPAYMTAQGDATTLSVAQATERGKQLMKHAEVLCSRMGRIRLGIGCVVDGDEVGGTVVQAAFVAGINRVSRRGRWR